MPQHDRQQTDDATPSGQFSGDDIEFAPFMFDPASQPVDVPTSRIGVGETDMEFEPFMFNQGEALGVPNPPPAGAATAQSPAQSGAVASIRPIQPLPDVSTAPPASPPSSSPAPEPSAMQAASEAPAQSPFAGQEVPMPSYLMPDVGSEPATDTGSASDAAAPSTGAAPLPEWLSGNAPTTGPVSQEADVSTLPTMSEGRTTMDYEPSSTVSEAMHATGPMETQAASAPAPTPVPASAPAQVPASAASAFSGMTGRSRGNTGPLSAGLATGSWSDSSLASIEDFSSVLIALHAGKRLRQSGPLNGAMLSQAAAPAASTETMVSGTQAPAAPGPESDIAQPFGQASPAPEQPMIPEWAAQSMVGGATAPTTGSPWEPQLPPHDGPAWPGMAQPQTALPEGEPLPPWSMNPPAEPPEATSWTAAQAEPAATSASAMPQPPVTSAPSLAQSTSTPAPTSTAPATPTPELDAIRQIPLDQPSQTLESGVSDLLKTVDPAISDRSVNGEDLQFESFMFNEGVSAPLPVLPAIDPAALANLPSDAGPAFDPTQYANPLQVEETVEYGDIDPAAFGVPSTGASQGAGTQGPLPFWLQDKPGYPLGAGAAGSQAAPQAQQSAQQPGGTSSAAANDEDLGELPPIAPFDFAALGTEVDDESFGFNTEELTGLVPGARDPMVVTANLEALADLMGGHTGIIPEIKSPRHTGFGNSDLVTSLASAAKSARPVPRRDALSAPEEASVDSEAGAVSVDAPTAHIMPDGSAAAGQEEPDSGSWIAAATANLPVDSSAAPANDVEAGVLTSDVAADVAADMTTDMATEMAPEAVVEDLGVSPFDYNQLDLDEGSETPTNYLQTGGMPQGPSTEMLEPASEQETAGSAGAAPGEFWSEADGDASLFMPAVIGSSADAAEAVEVENGQAPAGNPPEQVSPESSAGTVPSPPSQTDTGQLLDPMREADDIASGHSHPAGTGSGHVPTEPEQTIFRARVARGPWGSHSAGPPEPEQKPEEKAEPNSEPTAQQETSDPLKHLRKAARTAVLEPIEPEPPQRPPEEAATSTKGAEGVQEVSSRVDFEAENARNIPSFGDIMTSGPLPSLAGFEDLTAWIERYPNDMGAHLALASAYTQAGDTDTALRVYRRVLRKQYVSENILAMIQDELQDLEDEAQKHPRYHQVRGDLLVRLGQRRAAIDEYNKLA